MTEFSIFYFFLYLLKGYVRYVHVYFKVKFNLLKEIITTFLGRTSTHFTEVYNVIFN